MRRIFLLTIALVMTAALVGIRQGHAACTTVSVPGTNTVNWAAVPDAADCGTTVLPGGSWANYCVTEECASASVPCDTGSTCYVKTCPGGSSTRCHVYSPTFSASDCFTCLCP